MALEDFEKSLAEEKERKQREKSDRHRDQDRKHRHHHRHHHHRDRAEYHHESRKRRDHSADDEGREHRHKKRHHKDDRSEDERSPDEEEKESLDPPIRKPKRDSWMEAPSSLDIDYVQKGSKKSPEPTMLEPSKKDFHLKSHDNELNKGHLQGLVDGNGTPEQAEDEVSAHKVNYTIGDAGSQWRMKKLKRVYERAEEERKAVEEVAIEQFGDLRTFDDAREEQIELERRATYGSGYVVKEKPTGDLFAQRKSDMDLGRSNERPLTRDNDEDDETEDKLDQVLASVPAPAPSTTPAMDQTALNRLKAQMMKAKLRRDPQADTLEAEYNKALSSFTDPTQQQQPDVLVLNPMETRLLSGNKSNEVKSLTSKRGRERGLVTANDDMTIEDMVREEKRTRTAGLNDSTRYATRIARDTAFSTDLDYQDENATKLAQRTHKSTTALRNDAIASAHTTNRILSTCPLCHHEDTSTPPLAPIISLATLTYLTLPTSPPLVPNAASIIPIAHRANLLECDDDEWEELRNFMKSLTRFYHARSQTVIFYENAAFSPSSTSSSSKTGLASSTTTTSRHHASLEAIPLPPQLGALAPQFFKEAILSSDEEWSQHAKIIDTLSKSRQSGPGSGRNAFRRSLAKEMPYFHVWFTLDGGLGHVVEDSARWPRGDLFAREVVGGMLDLGPEVVRRQGRWPRSGGKDPEMRGRVEAFRRAGWGEFDWTKVLVEGG